MLLRMHSSWNLPSSCGSIKQCHMETDNYCMAQQSHSYTDGREMKICQKRNRARMCIAFAFTIVGKEKQLRQVSRIFRCGVWVHAGQRHKRMNLASVAGRGLSLRELEHLAFTSSIFSFPYIYTLARFPYLRPN